MRTEKTKCCIIDFKNVINSTNNIYEKRIGNSMVEEVTIVL
jgi:hypothetical protein